MNFLQDIWNSITDFLSDLWDKFKVWVVVALILIAVFFFPPLGLSAMLGVTTIGGVAITSGMAWAITAACLVAAFMIDPETAHEIFSMIGEAIGAVADSLLDVATTVGASLLSSPLGLVALGFGLWFLFFRDKEDEKTTINLETNPR